MTGYDPRLAAGLREMTEEVEVPRAPVASVVRRARVRRMRRRVLVASVPALALVAGGVVSIGSSTSSPPAAVVTPVAPALRLASATESTGASSFHQRYTFRIEGMASLPESAQQLLRPYDGMVAEGLFDPGAARGSLKWVQGDGPDGLQLLVDGDLYIGDGSTWKHPPGKFKGFDLTASGIEVSSDVTQFLGLLRETGEVRETPEGYEFTSGRVSGVIRVADGRISTVRLRVPMAAGSVTAVAVVEIALSDYGVPVTVAEPTNVVA